MLLFCLVCVEQWREYTPEDCDGYRSTIAHGVTAEECKQLCKDCEAIEYWSTGTRACLACLDHTKRRPHTDTTTPGYPPYVFVLE